MRARRRCRLLSRIEAGEQLTIACAGRSVAGLAPVGAPRRRRVAGRDAGRGWIAEDFDAPLPAAVRAAFSAAG